MTFWLELKEEFWLEHLGGQGCPLRGRGGVMEKVQVAPSQPFKMRVW